MSRRTVMVSVALVVLASAGTGTALWIDQRSERQAEVAAANREVRAAIAERQRALRDAAATGSDAAAALRTTLQEHLTVSDRTDEQLALDRAEHQEAMRSAGQRLQEVASRPPPSLPRGADEPALADDLGGLEDLEERAADLGGRLVAAADRAERWAQALADVRAQAQRYVQTVEDQPETHDPDHLRRLWEEERAVLADYRAAAEAAAEVEGLAPLAQAYLDYIDANLGFAGEVIALLEQGDIDAYNRRLRETFEGTDDPFGFQAAIEQGTEASLDQGVFVELRAIRTDATDLVVDLDAALEEVAPTPTG